MMKRNKVIFLLLIASFMNTSALIAQDLQQEKLSSTEKKNGVHAKFRYVNQYDGSMLMILYTNGTYFYTKNVTSDRLHSNGRWSKIKNHLFLRSDVDNENVPIKVQYLPIDSGKKTIFLVPVNLKNDRLSDARVFVNSSASFCFPFFDTCVGSYGRIDSIKVDFDNGYKSKWIKVDVDNSKKILITAQIDFLLTSYISFKGRKFKYVSGGIRPID